MWSDVRVALMMMAEQQEADAAGAREADGNPPSGQATSGGFGSPPPADVLALVPREAGG